MIQSLKYSLFSVKEKAEILVQVEKLSGIKDELTDQVTQLHAALEQEKSKVHSLTNDLKKFQYNSSSKQEKK